MTAPRPGLWADYYAPEFVVRVDGEVLDPTTKGDILQVGVVLDQQQPASFSLTISDWDDGHLTFKYSSTTVFDPGRQITIDLGYAGRLVRVMSGVVTSLSPNFPQSGTPVLTVGGQDRMRTMAQRQPQPGDRKVYKQKTDGQIAEEIADRWKMRADVDRTGPVHPVVWQKNQSDAVFLMERAKRIDFEFYVALDGGEEVLYFRPRKDGRDAGRITVYAFEWGRTLISFAPRLSTTGQVASVTVRGWDPKTKKPIVYTARSSDLPSTAGGARSGPATADKQTAEVIVDSPVLTKEEARRLAVSRLMERAHAFTTATAQIIGQPDLRPGDNVDIGGVGSRFNGRYQIKKVTHSLGSAGFTTSLELERGGQGTAGKPVKPAQRERTTR
jgi:phage protein D